MILWIIIAILWTIVILALGYSAGTQNGKSSGENSEGAVTYHVANPEVSSEQTQQLKTLWADYSSPKHVFREFDAEAQDHLETLWKDREFKVTEDPVGLTGRMTNIEERMTRLERRGGLNV